MLYPIENRYRTIKKLDGFWHFKIDEKDQGKEKGWSTGITDGILLAVPASWNDQTQDEFLRTYLGSGWYEKRFWLSPFWKNDEVKSRFEGINYRAEIWLNGNYVGKHDGGFTPFEFDISNIVETEAENILIVRVDCKLSENTVPMGNLPVELGIDDDFKNKYPSTSGDFFPYAGINRSVIIYNRPRNAIQDITLNIKVVGEDNRDGIVSYEIFTSPGISRCEISLIDQKMNKIKEKELICSEGKAKGNLTVKTPNLWNVGHPYLYRLQIKALCGNNVVDEYALQVGIREVKVQDGQLLLNGKPIFLQGFARHEDFHIIGRGTSHAVMIKDYELMKWTGANSFRTSHYPYSTEQMQLADCLGFLVIDEVPAVSLAMRSVTEKTLHSHKRQLKEMIERDKNHPSVIAWSVANEADTWREEAKGYFAEIADYIKELDSSRPNMIVSDSLPDRELVAQHFDLLGINCYFGWYQFPGQLKKAEEELSYYLDSFYEKFQKPIIVAEFGADSIPGLHSDPAEMFTEEYQAKLIKMYDRIIKSKPYIIGEHIWNLTDFKTQQLPLRVFYNRKGVFTRDRQPKMAAHLVRELWKKNKIE